MNDAGPAKQTAEILDEQLAALRDLAATTTDSCWVAKLIALSDANAREVFLGKFRDGYVFRGTRCINRIGIPEYKHVLAEFDCKPGTLCFIPPSFLVTVDIIHKKVVAILDPYLAESDSPTKSGCGCGDEEKASALTFANGCDYSADVRVEDGKVRARILGHDLEFRVPPGTPNGASAKINLHLCGQFCTKGGRAELFINGNRVSCYEVFGNCGC